MFLKQPKQKGAGGKLHIQYCVYLPLENPEIIIDLKELDADYYILFHGNFSVDSGRTGIQGYYGLLEEASIESVDDTETAIRYWNKILAQQILYPNIPAFFECIANSNVLSLNQKELNTILFQIENYKDFGKVPLIAENKYTVAKQGFALCYTKNDVTLEKKWLLFDIHKESYNNYIFMPDCNNLSVLSKVFPFIEKNETNFICKNPSLSTILPSQYEPNLEFMEKLISDISFSTEEEISLITEFIYLNQKCIQSSERMQSLLMETIKKNLSAKEINQIYSLRQNLKLLFEAINIATGRESLYKFYSVGNKDRNTTGFEDSDWKYWWIQKSKFVLIPGFIDINQYCSEIALIEGTEDGSDSICYFVNNVVEQPDKQYFLLSGLCPELRLYINKIIIKYPDIHLFEIKNMNIGKNEYANTKLICELKEDKELFKAIRPNDYEHILYFYSQLIKSYTIYTISNNVIERTGLDTTGILPAESESIIESYVAHKNFMDYEYNISILPKFLEALCSKKPIFKDTEKFHIRFLISNFDKDLLPDEDLFIYDSRCNEVWKKIFDECRGEVKIISSEFESYTRDTIIQNGNLLRICVIDDSHCVSELKNACALNKTDFILDDYYSDPKVLLTILKELNYMTDKDVFYKLPIHINSKTKKRQKCYELCYLNALGIEFPPDFQNPNILFDLYDDADLANKQKDFFGEGKTLNYILAIKMVLIHKAENKDYSRWIFNQIKNSGNKDWSKYVATDEIGLSKWIPLSKRNDSFCCLRNILPYDVFSSDSEKTISEVLPIYTLDDLDIAAENRDLLERKKLLLTDQSTIFSVLVDLISNMGIDSIPIEDVESLRQISEVLKNNRSFPQFCIAWALFQDKKIKDQSKIFTEFYSQIRCTSLNSYELFVDMINSSIVGKQNTIELFNKVLELILKNYRENFVLTDIKQYPVMGASVWKNPDEIAASHSTSIIPDYKLYDSTYILLKDFIEESRIDINDIKATEKRLNDSSNPDEILQVFDPWLVELKQVKLLYVLLFLLKDNFKKAAFSRRNEADFECFTKDFDYHQKSDNAPGLWNAGYTQQEAMEDKFTTSNRTGGLHFHTNITIPLEGVSTLHSLSGKLVHVILESTDDVDELFLEEPRYNDYSNTFSLQLAKISKNTTNIDEKLKNLIQLILEKGYSQRDVNEIRRVLNTISQSNKYSVKATSIQIMDEIFGTFKQLGLNAEGRVKQFIQKERELSRSKATGKISPEDYASGKEKLIEELERLITDPDDNSFRITLRNAVKNKISDNQYDTNSVLFELLQNADDAVKDIIHTKPCCRFEVNIEDKENKKALVISHYGREINQSPVGTDPMKYMDDLYNMLTINSSSKSKQDRDTGKFGLGFKSVHLICNKPVVRSGELHFEILGGMYPNTITDKRIKNGETRIKLPLRTKVDEKQIISEFEKNAALQTVFCKCINEISINGINYSSENTPLYELSTGIVSLIETSTEEKYLLFKNPSDSLSFSILFKLSDDKNKVVEMKKNDGKKIWNTTPLSDGENLPFAINSEFIPDTGRKHLADNKNGVILSKIANDFSLLLSDYAKTQTPVYLDSIFDVLVASSNIREQLFNNFAKEVLQNLYKFNNGVIANGYGSNVDCSRKLVYVEPTSFGLDADRASDFLSSVQNYLNLAPNNKYYLITGVAKKCYTNQQLSEIEQITELADLLLKYAEDSHLSNEILLSFIEIVNKADRARVDIKWDRIYLRSASASASDDWVKANTIIMDDSNDKDEQHLNSCYEKEVQYFLSKYLPKDAELAKLKNSTNPTFVNTSNNLPANVPIKVNYDVKEVYDWWVKEKESGNWEKDIEDYYEEKHFPSILSSGLRVGSFWYSDQELFGLPKGTIPREWCLLLWIAAAQSMPYNWGNRDTANQKGMQVLEEMGVFDDFCSGVNLQEVYDKYLSVTQYDETRIRLFEMLLRIHKYRKNFADYYDLWKNLPNKTNEKIIESFLVPSADEELSGCGIDLASGNKTFSIGYRLIIQNLSLCGFWNSIEEENMRKLFKVFRGLQDYEFNLQGLPYAKEFYSCLDLPFLIYAGKK